MDRYSLKKLEFHKIKEMLEAFCQTPLGIPHVRDLEPSSDMEEILRAQAETTEAVHARRLNPDLTLAGISDLAPFLRRAAIGGVLEPHELLLCKDTLAATAKIKQGILQINMELPYLRSRAAALEECRQLRDKINFCILPEGDVADDASVELAKLRRQIRNLEAKARTQLEEILAKPDWLRFLQEPIYTMRGDRYVVPVKQEYRHQFPGIVHDQSASGATVFMEPLPLVKTMNELAATRAAAHQEELRVLEELSRLVAVYHDEIGKSLKLLGELDFIFAKGHLSEKMKGQAPQFSENGWLELRGGRHPLLQGEVVPLDLHLGRDFDCLIITGPNTGGKTVALKTVGLLALMAQSGLHVPAGDGTVFPCFMDVFADIGDEQSIEQSLSTFSGHMTNIIRILQKAGKGTLVILDELGAGTDPEQGASLGMAILECLMQKGALIIATTHYSELKVFAHSQPRAENASVEFDSVTLRPTYRLAIGVPGESNAFEIASRLGLPTEVVERARTFLRPEQRELSELIQHLKEDQFAALTARTEAERLKTEVQQLRNKLKQEEERVREKEKQILAKAAEEGRELLRTARREAEQLIRSLREEQRKQPVQERLRIAHQARERLNELAGKIEEKIGEQVSLPQGEPVGDVKPGDLVAVPRFNQQGYVLDHPDSSGNVMVQIGALKLKLPLAELRQGRQEIKQDAHSTRRSGTIEQNAAVSPEFDLRGQRVEDALENVDKYLDAAYLAGIQKVTLIHGKGTGVLRDVVQKYLAKHPFVASFRLGTYQEGGTGVTIVHFK